MAGRWRYLYGAVDQFGQVIDVLASNKRDAAAARRFFVHALTQLPAPAEVTTDRAPSYLGVVEDLLPAALHVTEQYANDPVEADHGRLKACLRPMRGVKRLRSAAVVAAGHAFIQNLRRGHYELAVDIPPPLRLAEAFTELARAMRAGPSTQTATSARGERNTTLPGYRPYAEIWAVQARMRLSAPTGAGGGRGRRQRSPEGGRRGEALSARSFRGRAF